jgi:hypothetical protein
LVDEAGIRREALGNAFLYRLFSSFRIPTAEREFELPPDSRQHLQEQVLGFVRSGTLCELSHGGDLQDGTAPGWGGRETQPPRTARGKRFVGRRIVTARFRRKKKPVIGPLGGRITGFRFVSDPRYGSGETTSLSRTEKAA